MLTSYDPMARPLPCRYELLWLDADLVVFRDPFEALAPFEQRSGGGYDMALQREPGSHEAMFEWETSLLYPEFVTGVLHAKPTLLAKRLLKESMHRQVRNAASWRL